MDRPPPAPAAPVRHAEIATEWAGHIPQQIVFLPTAVEETAARG
ncbi:hypothetical protein ACIP98_27485 [Streptomyces sp. NPDC088354]